MSDAQDKPYIIRVIIESISPGYRNQRHILEEGSMDEKEHVAKNFAVDEAVSNAVRAAMKELAAPFLRSK